jgi:Sec-independent protein secretion pathway component TatC
LSPDKHPGPFFIFSFSFFHALFTYFCGVKMIPMMWTFFLQVKVLGQNPELSKASDYFPIGIQLLFAVGLVTVMILGSQLLGPRRVTTDITLAAIHHHNGR